MSKQERSAIKGEIGEGIVNLLAKYYLDKNEYHVVNDVTFRMKDGSTQVDHIIVSKYGIFVIETKNYNGWIFGKEFEPWWTQRLLHATNSFQNPIRQNLRHIKSLSEMLGLVEEKIFSVIVFVGESEFKTPMPEYVTYGPDYTNYVKSKTDILLTDREVFEYLQKIEEYRLCRGESTNREHIQNLQERFGKSWSLNGEQGTRKQEKNFTNFQDNQPNKAITIEKDRELEDFWADAYRDENPIPKPQKKKNVSPTIWGFCKDYREGVIVVSCALIGIIGFIFTISDQEEDSRRVTLPPHSGKIVERYQKKSPNYKNTPRQEIPASRATFTTFRNNQLNEQSGRTYAVDSKSGFPVQLGKNYEILLKTGKKIYSNTALVESDRVTFTSESGLRVGINMRDVASIRKLTR